MFYINSEFAQGSFLPAVRNTALARLSVNLTTSAWTYTLPAPVSTLVLSQLT